MPYDFSHKLPHFHENGLLFWGKQKPLPLVLGSISFVNYNCTLDYNFYMIMTVPAKNRKIFSSTAETLQSFKGVQKDSKSQEILEEQWKLFIKYNSNATEV